MSNLCNSKVYDVVVVGNAALGCALAYRLKTLERNAKIAVVGPSAREGSATTTAGAMINVWAEIAVGQFDDPALSDRAELAIAGGSLWDAHCAELSETSGHALAVKWGTYVLQTAKSSPHEQRTMDYMLSVMRARNVEHRVVDSTEVSWLKPEYGAGTQRAVWVPDGRIDSRKVLIAYEKAFRILGVEQIDSTVERLTVRGTERSITLADGSVLIAKDIVLANGSFAQALVDQVPEVRTATPRLLWGAGSAVDMAFPSWITRDGGGLDRHILDMDAVIRTTDRGGACGVHVIPYGNGEYYVGASSGVWFEPEYKARLHAVEVLLRSVCEEINYAFFYAGIELRGPGFRPTTVDTFPLLGQSHVSGIWFANGTKRDGFTCSPHIANELAAAILGRRPSRLPQRFTPSRKIISYKSRQQALGDAIVANVGGEFQHGLRLPPYALDAYYTQKRAQYEAIYDKRGFAEFGIHPEVLHIYDNDGYFAAVDIPREVT